MALQNGNQNKDDIDSHNKNKIKRNQTSSGNQEFECDHKNNDLSPNMLSEEPNDGGGDKNKRGHQKYELSDQGATLYSDITSQSSKDDHVTNIVN